MRIETVLVRPDSNIYFYKDFLFFKYFTTPVCTQAYSTTQGSALSLGEYAGGEGDFLAGDPMLYEGGYATECGIPSTSEAYWYCWYDTRDIIVGLDHV